jgi:hypothetical protein
MSQPYRPSNGTEGEMFQEHYCAKCIHDDYERGKICHILARTMPYNIGDPEYPTEWIIDDDAEPIDLGYCTAFELREKR